MEDQNPDQFVEQIINGNTDRLKSLFEQAPDKLALLQRYLNTLSEPVSGDQKMLIEFFNCILMEPFEPLDAYIENLAAAGEIYLNSSSEIGANLNAIQFYSLAYELAKGSGLESYRTVTCWNLLDCYMQLNDAGNQELILSLLKEAEQIVNEGTLSYLLPSLRLVIGEYYAGLLGGDHLQNKREAVNYFNQALDCLDEDHIDYSELYLKAHSLLADQLSLLTDDCWELNLDQAIEHYKILIEQIGSSQPDDFAEWNVIQNCCLRVRQCGDPVGNSKYAAECRAAASQVWPEESIRQIELQYFDQLSSNFDIFYPYEDYLKYCLILEASTLALRVAEEQEVYLAASLFIRVGVARIMLPHFGEDLSAQYATYSFIFRHLRSALDVVLNRTDEHYWTYRSLHIVSENDLDRFYFESEIETCAEIIEQYNVDTLYHAVLCEFISIMYLYRNTGTNRYNVRQAVSWREKACDFHRKFSVEQDQISIVLGLATDILKYSDFRMTELSDKGFMALNELDQLMLNSSNARTYLAYEMQYTNLYFCMLVVRNLINRPFIELEKMAKDAFGIFQRGRLLGSDEFAHQIGTFYLGLWTFVRTFGDWDRNPEICCECMRYVIETRDSFQKALPDYIVGVACYIFVASSFRLQDQDQLREERQKYLQIGLDVLDIEKYPMERAWLLSKIYVADPSAMHANDLNRHMAHEQVRVKYGNAGNFSLSIERERHHPDPAIYESLVRYFVSRNDPASALTYLMYIKSRPEIDNLYIKEPIQWRQEWDREYEELRSLRNQHSLLLRKIGDLKRFSDGNEVDSLNKEANVVEGKINELIREMRLDFPELSDVKYRKLIGSDQIHSLMRTLNTCLIEYYFDGSVLCAFVINGDGVHYRSLLGGDTLNPIQAAGGIEPGPSARQMLDLEPYFDEPLMYYQKNMPVNEGTVLKRLSGVLIEPCLELLTSKNLLISVSGNLFSVPFNALPLKGGEKLSDHFDITITSSSAFFDAMLEMEREQGAKIASGNFLSVTHSGIEDSFLEELPNVRVESEVIAQNFASCTNLADKDATTENLVYHCANNDYDAIHFGCHGQYMWQNSHRGSGLWLSDFLSINTIINQVKLQGRPIVSLACCQSGDGSIEHHSSVISVAHSFLVAGASVVIANIWSVDDEASLTFYRTFYFLKFKQGLSTRQAFRRAIDTLRANPKWRNPFYWGGYYLTGVID